VTALLSPKDNRQGDGLLGIDREARTKAVEVGQKKKEEEEISRYYGSVKISENENNWRRFKSNFRSNFKSL
jgi:hypothetical protein